VGAGQANTEVRCPGPVGGPPGQAGQVRRGGLPARGPDGGRGDPAAGRLHLARGETRLAVEVVERAVRTADPGSSACIPLLVDAQLACGEDAGADHRRPGCLRGGAPVAVRQRARSPRSRAATTAVLRELGQKVAPPKSSGQTLTRRELDVLGLLGRACPTRRSPSASSSAARRSSTTSATSWSSSGCATGPRPRPTPYDASPPRNRGVPRYLLAAEPTGSVQERGENREARRHRHRSARRRVTDRHAAGPQGLPGARRRPCVPKRHPLDRRHPRAPRSSPEAR
jgi:hypothetical protein